MSDTVIAPELCPVCGRMAWLVRLMSGLHYGHGRGECFGRRFVPLDEAEGVRRIREDGGERLRLAAHP